MMNFQYRGTRRAPKNCVICQTGFIPRNKKSKYCSEKCALTIKNPPRLKVCHFCKELKYFDKYRIHYCSKSCAVEAKRRKYRGLSPIKMPKKTVFVPGHTVERIWSIDFLEVRGNEAKKNLKDMFGSMFRVNT